MTRFLFLLGNSFDWLQQGASRRAAKPYLMTRTDRRPSGDDDGRSQEPAITVWLHSRVDSLTENVKEERNPAVRTCTTILQRRLGALQLAHVLSRLAFALFALKSSWVWFHSNDWAVNMLWFVCSYALRMKLITQLVNSFSIRFSL